MLLILLLNQILNLLVELTLKLSRGDKLAGRNLAALRPQFLNLSERSLDSAVEILQILTLVKSLLNGTLKIAV